jgi:hypothetical protein
VPQAKLTAYRITQESFPARTLLANVEHRALRWRDTAAQNRRICIGPAAGSDIRKRAERRLLARRMSQCQRL